MFELATAQDRKPLGSKRIACEASLLSHYPHRRLSVQYNGTSRRKNRVMVGQPFDTPRFSRLTNIEGELL